MLVTLGNCWSLDSAIERPFEAADRGLKLSCLGRFMAFCTIILPLFGLELQAFQGSFVLQRCHPVVGNKKEVRINFLL